MMFIGSPLIKSVCVCVCVCVCGSGQMLWLKERQMMFISSLSSSQWVCVWFRSDAMAERATDDVHQLDFIKSVCVCVAQVRRFGWKSDR